MKQEEFEYYCSRRAPEHIRPFIKMAVRAAASLNIEFEEASVSRVVMMAGSLYDDIKDIVAEKPPETLLELSPEGIIHSDMLLTEILPSILEVRNAVSGADSPPFPNDIKGAIKWLDEETQKQAEELAKRTSQMTLPELIKMVTETIPRYLNRKSCSMPGHQLKLTVERLTLNYRSMTGQTKQRLIIRGTPLHSMAEKLRHVSTETGFPFEMLLIFLLTGIQPVLPGIRIRTSIKRSKTVSVDFLRSLSRREIMALHSVLRKAFRGGRKSFSLENFEIYQFVKGKGGVPMKGKKAFWIQLCREWNKARPDKRYKSYECFRVSYQRIVNASRKLRQQHNLVPKI
jgi:hypothetical protein